MCPEEECGCACPGEDVCDEESGEKKGKGSHSGSKEKKGKGKGKGSHSGSKEKRGKGKGWGKGK